VIGLKAVNCQSGDLLAEAQEQAASKEGVLKALDAAAVRLRSKLGESLNTVQEYATPLSEATTPSLEALKAYSLGRKIRFAKGDATALPFLKRAVELDPNFASAYLSLSGIYANLNETELSIESARKAYDLREKVSEREKFGIEFYYYGQVTGEMDKAAQTCELWQRNYPRDFQAHGSLGAASFFLGHYEKALEEYREALRLEPNYVITYLYLGDAYRTVNRLDEAEAVYRQAEEHKLEGEWLLHSRYLLAFLKGDATQMERFASAAMGKPGAEDLLLAAQADTQAWYGKFKNARELTRRAMDSAEHNDAKETAAFYQAESAWRESEAGNREKARAEANAALKLAPNRDVKLEAALTLARAGDTAEAEKLAAELEKSFPLGSVAQRRLLPTIRAAVAMERKDPNRAVELLKGETDNLAIIEDDDFQIKKIYVCGEAYLALGDGERAATEFQKLIDRRGMVTNYLLGALARLGLGRAYAMQGNPTKARAAYQDFLTLWKDADPDIPILKQAKAEYAKLQ
jgi:tetratricopeptide (TPR) repeat protein